MLKRKVYDILTIVFIILVIAIYFLSAYLFSDMGLSVNNMTSLTKIPIYILSATYYIFILVLAIQLYKKDKLSITNTVVIAIVAPLAFLFYLLTLRRPLEESEQRKTTKKKT